MLTALLLALSPFLFHLLMKLLKLEAEALAEWTGLECKGCHRC
jgi:hypothetical protein